jgi:NIMA (never in mitosis gene a)-related kinase
MLIVSFWFKVGGDLLQHIKQARGHYFPEAQILDWFTQIALALKHCHDRKILHRDIKSQNIFLTSKNTAKLGDFGIAKVLSNTIDKARTIVGTPYYISPEIIQNKPYNFASDIWSLGVILYELCALKPPFDAPSISALGFKIVRGVYQPIPSHYSRELKTFVSQLLSAEPMKRPRINEILSNFFKDYNRITFDKVKDK